MACIEFTTTSACNYGCKYCFEGHYKTLDDSRIKKSKTVLTPEQAYEFCLNLMEKCFPDEEQYNISYWGGEPCLNFDFIYDLTKLLAKHEKCDFMIYTNGSFIERDIDRIVELQELLGDSRFNVQVSYDGVCNDLKRVDKGNRGTAKKTIRAFRLLRERGVSCNTKSVVAPDTFKYMYLNFVDCIETLGASYGPSPDLHSIYRTEEVQPYLNDLKQSLVKIAKYIYDKGIDSNNFSWFRENKATCRAGFAYITVDVDGSVFPCHGFMYLGDKYVLGKYDEPDVFDKINAMSERMRVPVRSSHPNGECENCDVLYCCRCPSANVGLADQCGEADRPLTEKYARKNNFTCSVFKIADKVHKSLNQAILDRKNVRSRSRPDRPV